MRVDTVKIKRLREKKGLSQRQAAEAAGWKTAQQWSAIENGKHGNPRVKTLGAMATVLGCRVDQLLTEKR
jgi:transcriptional regulator with XRE-family HTH domain